MEKYKLEFMDFVNKTVEPFIRTFPENYEIDGEYYRSFVKTYEIRINGLVFKYDQFRYFNKNKVYVKTLFIMLFNHLRLEDDDFYVSFTRVTKNLDNNDKNKYRYGLFSKKYIPDEPKLLLIELTGIYEKSLNKVRYDPFFFKFSNNFFSKNNSYPYVGININPLLVARPDYCLAAFICPNGTRNLVLHEIQSIEEYRYFGSTNTPRLYFENIKTIGEDEELNW
jgi:hypothetical protein